MTGVLTDVEITYHYFEKNNIIRVFTSFI